MQIDVMHIVNDTVVCNLHTGERVVKMYINRFDYEKLMGDGFFLRSGKNCDSARVYNTTRVYQVREETEEERRAKWYVFAWGEDCDGTPVKKMDAFRGPYTNLKASQIAEALQDASDGIRYRVIDEEELFEMTGGRSIVEEND